MGVFVAAFIFLVFLAAAIAFIPPGFLIVIIVCLLGAAAIAAFLFGKSG
ncbi:hypothetical protein [Halovibrio variabilis]|nr:hypothetical protein [Halovibrio variabilis]